MLWKTTPFKPYNFLMVAERAGGGQFHPLLTARAKFHKIPMEMGFQEMPSNKWVQSSFWNFDSLLRAQSRPARDVHNTFFIKEPAETWSVPTVYFDQVKTTYEVGQPGSIGHQYDFQEVHKNLLPTHTAAVSLLMLHKPGNKERGGRL